MPTRFPGRTTDGWQRKMLGVSLVLKSAFCSCADNVRGDQRQAVLHEPQAFFAACAQCAGFPSVLISTTCSGRPRLPNRVGCKFSVGRWRSQSTVRSSLADKASPPCRFHQKIESRIDRSDNSPGDRESPTSPLRINGRATERGHSSSESHAYNCIVNTGWLAGRSRRCCCRCCRLECRARHEWRIQQPDLCLPATRIV